MQDRKYAVVSCGDFETQYDAHLLRVRGLSQSTRNGSSPCSSQAVDNRLSLRPHRWSDFHFQDVVRFVTGEFRRLHSRETQRTWLMVLRSVLRYLAQEGQIAAGWDAALPPIANRQHARLPRGLTKDEVDALLRASDGAEPTGDTESRASAAYSCVWDCALKKLLHFCLATSIGRTAL